MHLLTIIGARPQIIKAAAISRAISTAVNSQGVPFKQIITEHILHTGQHYDHNMSGTFFKQLAIPEPEFNLNIGSASHGVQTAKMIEGIEQVLINHHFDGVLLYGDTNSTLAGAVAAAKMNIPIFHVEAGLRSYNMSMPEEQNRIVCDHLSTILFAPTQTAINNLEMEGIGIKQEKGREVHFTNGKVRKVVLSGDVMYDNSMYFASLADKQSTILTDLNIEKKHFILATIHRDNNTDTPERLHSILNALIEVAKQVGQPIVLPLHPRTRKKITEWNKYQQLLAHPLIKIIDPVPFFDIIMLERHSSLVLTDSGGVQKEAFFFETPCVILRPQTEWTEIIDAGAGILADANEETIITSALSLINIPISFPPLFGNAHAAEKIIDTITSM